MHISRAINEAMRLIGCNLIAMLVLDLSRPYRLILCNFIILFIIYFFFQWNSARITLVYTFAHLYARETKNKILSFICNAKAPFTYSSSFIVHKISFTRHVARIVKSLVYLHWMHWHLRREEETHGLLWPTTIIGTWNRDCQPRFKSYWSHRALIGLYRVNECEKYRRADDKRVLLEIKRRDGQL